MLLPYRVKNPPKRFPFVTLSLIAANVLVYVFTTSTLLEIRPDIVENYAFAIGLSPLVNFITASFLHAEPFHLLGNMLFLWLFGPSVEDRLGKIQYIFLYFVTGFAGDILQGLVDKSLLGVPRPGIGASGCIMGVVGAYWYIFPWSRVCVVYWFGWFWRGITDIAAVWVVGLFVLMDVFEGVLLGAAGMTGGVANFAHIGGAVLGALMVMGMMVKRDTEAVSEAKAIQADAHDYENMPLEALQIMIAEDRQNTRLIRATTEAATRLRRMDVVADVIVGAGVGLIEQDPSLVAWYLVDCKGSPAQYKPIELLRLARRMREALDPVRAAGILEIINSAFPASPEAEAALYDLASYYWNHLRQPEAARKYLNEMATRFPNGPMTQFRRALMGQMETNVQQKP